MGYIYKITNTCNDKVYVGQTVQSLHTRWAGHLYKANSPRAKDNDYPLYRAMRKYGSINFSIQVIEEVPKEKLDEREIYWIKEFDCIAPKGYNCNQGGSGNSRLDRKEIIDYFLKCKNASETARYFNCSLHSVLNILDANNIPRLEPGFNFLRPVYQIGLNNGEIVNKYSSISEAAGAVRCSPISIGLVCMNYQKTACGFIWCYPENYDVEKIKEYKDFRKKAVRCIENGLEFNSQSDASRWLKENNPDLNGSISTLSKNIARAIRTGIRAYSFHWERI